MVLSVYTVKYSL